jgi:hypothetical protein
MNDYTKLDGTSYAFLTEDATRRIFPKGRDGKSIPVTLDKHHLHLRYGEGNATVTFTKYKYQGRFLYRDSRQEKRSSFNDIVKETQRMLKMSREDAVSFLTAAWNPVAAS